MKSIVIKVGSSTIIMQDRRFNQRRFDYVVQQIKVLQSANYSVFVVVSGAVAAGSHLVNGEHITRQVAAGVGQVRLISNLQKAFQKENISIAQILVSKHDFEKVNQRKSLKTLLGKYIENHVVPVFNENDVVHLNSFGGNDYLAVELAALLDADEVIIISSMRGSPYGIGGRFSKIEAQKQLERKNIRARIINSDRSYTLLM